jgi:hypothetical protein
MALGIDKNVVHLCISIAKQAMYLKIAVENVMLVKIPQSIAGMSRAFS